MLAGYVIAAAAGVFIQDSGLFGASGESPVARTYMLALLQRDPNSIVGIRPNQSIAQRAAELQAADSSRTTAQIQPRSEEHTSELQSQFHLVCRLLLEKKNQ